MKKYPEFSAAIDRAYDSHFEKIDKDIERDRVIFFRDRRKYFGEKHYPQRKRDEKGTFKGTFI